MERPYLPGFKPIDMKTLATTLTLLALTAGPGLAAGPIGEWLTEKGDARIRIENCGDQRSMISGSTGFSLNNNRRTVDTDLS